MWFEENYVKQLNRKVQFKLNMLMLRTWLGKQPGSTCTFSLLKEIEVISRDVVIIENPFHALTIPLYYLLYPLN